MESLTEGDIQDPMQAVLDTPVTADSAGEVLDIALETGDEEMHLVFDDVTDPAGLDAAALPSNYVMRLPWDEQSDFAPFMRSIVDSANGATP